jgi:signal transduction histidine kinase
VIVLASFFAMFSAVEKSISLLNITLIMLCGTAYIALGVYGYDFCARSAWTLARPLYFGIQIFLGSFIIYLGKGAGFNSLILLPLVGHAVVLVAPAWQRSITLAIVSAYTISVYLYAKDVNVVINSLPVFLAGAVFIMVFTQMAVNEEKARNQVEQLVVELEKANQNLRGYAVQAEELAIAKERNRLAREIHDGLGHYLTAIHMQIQAARALVSKSNIQADTTLHKAQNLTQEALDDVRQSVASLRAAPGQDKPLQESLKQMPLDCLDGTIKWSFSLLGTPRPLSPQAHLTLYRAAQEGLNNVRKHAQASRVDLCLDFMDPDNTRLRIQDDGIGTESMEGGFGLLGMQERAHLLGGDVQLESGKGQGFRLEVVLPG